ncbi:MAG: hypothetical protein ACXAC2_21925 [Candidatus Kariarchaeaceae archaeon]|jgi:hypothetical protein
MSNISCDKHEKFNYYCQDCQEVKRKFEIRQKVKQLERGELYENLDPIEPPRRINLKSAWFRGRPRLTKYLKIVIPVAVIILVLLTVLWFWPSWIAPINLNAQLYAKKAGNPNFYKYYFLNFWSINFFFNKTALVGAFIGCIIMSIPPNRNLLTIIGTRLGFGKPSILKSLIFWWTAGFVLFYLVGMTLDMNGQFSWIMYLFEQGEIRLSPLTIFTDAFDVLLNQNNVNLEFIFIYTRLYLPLISYIGAICIIRLALNIASNFYLRRNDYYIAANGLIIGGIVSGLIFMILPTFALDGIQLLQMWSFVIASVILLALGITVYVLARIKLARNSTSSMILNLRRMRIALLAAGLIVLIIIPSLISLGPAFTISNASVYSEYE